MTEPSTPPTAENEPSRRTARLEKLAQRFGDPFYLTQFAKTHAANDIKDKYAALPAGEKTSDSVTVAGRIMAIRNSGMFIVILDDTDRLQIFHDLKQLPPERAELLDLLDLGAPFGKSEAIVVRRVGRPLRRRRACGRHHRVERQDLRR
jgi:lysyl-tRNA synthetase class 2